MEIRLWHWIVAFGLALSLHLMPFLWLGSGSGGEGAGRRFQGLSVILEPPPVTSQASASSETPVAPIQSPAVPSVPPPESPASVDATNPEAVETSPADAQPNATELVEDIAPADTLASAPPIDEAPIEEQIVPAQMDARVVTTEPGDAGALVIAEEPLHPLAGGLESAPPSAALETPPVVAEPLASPSTPTLAAPAPSVTTPPATAASEPSPAAAATVAPQTTPTLEQPSASPSSGGERGDVAVDRGPLLGAARPAPEPTPLAPDLATTGVAMPTPPVVVPDVLNPVDTVTVGEIGEAAISTPTPAPAMDVPGVAAVTTPVRPLDPAGVESGPTALSAAVEAPPVDIAITPALESTQSTDPTLPAPADIASDAAAGELLPATPAVPPPPGGDTLAATVSPRSEAVLPAGPLIGEDGAVMEVDATTVSANPSDPGEIAVETPVEPTATVASIAQPPDVTAVDVEESVLAEESAMVPDDGLALPEVELQSRSSPARSWSDMLPAEVAARLPADTPRPAGNNTASQGGVAPSLTVDGARSSGDASARGRYLALIQSWLTRHKHYPHQARQQGLEGSAQVRLVVNRSGEIQSYQFLTQTGHPLLDRAVEALLEQASPLPSTPGFLADEEISMVVNISYSLQ